MSKSVEVKAKTIDKAIEEALEILGASYDEVDVEVLAEGGFLAKAKVLVTVKGSSKPEEIKAADKIQREEAKAEKKEAVKVEKEEKKFEKAVEKAADKVESSKSSVTDVKKETKREEKVEKKIGRLERLFPNDTVATITFSLTRHDHKVEITMPLHKRILRAEVVRKDMLSAVDDVVDALEKQVVKHKGRLRSRSRKDNAYKDELKFYSANDSDAGDDSDIEVKIEKIKRFSLKPMSPEDAVLEMELSGHDFYVFRNAQSDEINVVYKRKAGSYGLIESDY